MERAKLNQQQYLSLHLGELGRRDEALAGLPLADCKPVVDRNLSPARLAATLRQREDAVAAMEQIADEAGEHPDALPGGRPG